MKHTDFMSMVLDEMKSRLGKIPLEELLRKALEQTDSVDLRSDLVISIVDQVAPRYGCDITLILRKYDYEELAKQIAVILISFGRSHTRKCDHYDEIRGATITFNRFINTYLAMHLWGEIPDQFPYRKHIFFLNQDDKDYTSTDEPGHSLDSEQLRRNVEQWNITGNG